MNTNNTYPAQRLAKYLRVKAMIKRLEIIADDLKEQILHHAGEFPSTYTVKITEYEQERVAAISQIKDRSEKLYAALVQAGCINHTTQTRLTVKRNEEE